MKLFNWWKRGPEKEKLEKQTIKPTLRRAIRKRTRKKHGEVKSD